MTFEGRFNSAVDINHLLKSQPKFMQTNKFTELGKWKLIRANEKISVFCVKGLKILVG